MGPLRDLVAGEARGRVLEIGCGTGLNLSHYAWPRLDVLEATEPDPFMLRRAERRLARLPAYAREKARLTQAPAEALPFEDEAFDEAVSTLVLCTVADPSRALAEVRRVLKPGGALRLVEHVQESGFAGRAQSTLQPVYGWLAGGCHWNRRTEETIREAGFSLDVTMRPRLGPMFPAFLGVAQKPSP
jgi:ubiquinone/menaquinone biosynthesis C-methylase UbiE